MRSVLHQRGKVFGILLCVVLTLSVYAGFVGVVNELFGHDFIQAISLSSQVHSKDDYRFAMGETIILSAKVKKGNVYRLNVYDNSDRVVFEDAGGVNGSDVRVPVPVRPSAFNAGQVYKLAFQAGLVNYPLLGIGTYDYADGPFAVVKSLTRLNLTANYDAVSHELQAVAFLITNDSVPVENRTISLYTQPDLDLSLNDKGWVCLSQRQTDENGTALFNIAVNARGGAYGLEARFAGDDDFGASTSLNATRFVEVSPVPLLRAVGVERVKGGVSVLLRVTDSYGFPLGGRLLSYEAVSLGGDPVCAVSNGTGYASITLSVGSLLSFVDSKISVLGDAYTSRLQAVARLNLTGAKPFFERVSGSRVSDVLMIGEEPAKSGGVEKVSMSGAAMLTSYPSVSVSLDNNPAMADMPETISVDYATATNQGSLQFQFSQNGTFLASVHAHCVRHRLVDPDGEYMYSWEYSGTLVWQPGYYGGCSLTVLAVDVNNATVAQGLSSFSIRQAPVNLVVYYPMTFCGSSLEVSVALSRSRVLGQGGGSGFFQSSTLAPTFGWTGDTYALDCGDANSTLIKVFVNSSLAATFVPGPQGFYSLQVPLSSLGSNGSLNVTACTDGNCRFGQRVVANCFNFMAVTVSDVPSAGSDSFALNCSLNVADGERTYVNLQNSVNISASLFGSLRVFNASASVVTARLISRDAIYYSYSPSIPSSCNYLRLKSACNIASGMASPLADVNRDGRVWWEDLNTVLNLCNRKLGDSAYDWHYDLDGDGKISMNDLIIILDGSSWGRSVQYLSNSDDGYDYSNVRVDFWNGSSVHLDSRGFVSVPSGVQGFNVSVGGVAIGGIVEFYTVDTAQNVSTDNLGLAGAGWSPTSVGLYIVQAKLPSTLNVTVAFHLSGPLFTQADASLNVVSYFYVLKRPIDFSVDVQGDFHVATLEASANALVLENMPDSNLEQNPLWRPYLYVSDAGVGYRRESYIRFDVSSIPNDASIVSARLCLYVADVAPLSNFSVGFFRVTASWQESDVTWNSRPTCAPTPSQTLTMTSDELGKWLFVDLAEEVRMWKNNTENDGFALKNATANDWGVMGVFSRFSVLPSLQPVLEVSYVLPSPLVVAGAIDHVTGQPVSGLSVQFNANGVGLGNAVSNSSGVAVAAWQPPSNAVYSVAASSMEDGAHVASVGSSVFDYRLPTNIVSHVGNSTTTGANLNATLGFDVLDNCALCGLAGMSVDFYVNGTSYDGTSYHSSSYQGSGTTFPNGTVMLNWPVPSGDGTYSFRASFGGDSARCPCEAYVAVTVHTVALAVLFSVSPAEFQPGSLLLLNATVLDASTNTRFTSQPVTVRFYNISSGGTTSFYDRTTTDGVATLPNFPYPNDTNAYAFKAEVVPAYAGGNLSQGIVSSPVQLMVASPTVLLLDVSRDNSSTQHVVEGWLKSGDSGVSNKTVTVRVNDDVYSTNTTDDGYFSLTLDLQPKIPNGQSAYQTVTYNIQASFAGDTPVNATAWANMLDGTSYAACTTTQYGYKPCSNSTVLTVDPQSTLTTTLTKTPEEMQQEAKQNGTLRDYDEWSWWYPWYRRHFVYVYEGVEQFDQGISPIPLVAETLKCADAFLSILRTLWSVVVWPTVVAVFTAEFFALITCNTGPWGFALALGISIGNKMVSAGLNWNSIGNLAGAVIGNVFSTVYGMLKWTWALASGVLKLLMGTISLMSFGLGNVYRIFSFFSNVFYIGTIMTRLHELGAIA